MGRTNRIGLIFFALYVPALMAIAYLKHGDVTLALLLALGVLAGLGRVCSTLDSTLDSIRDSIRVAARERTPLERTRSKDMRLVPQRKPGVPPST